MPTLPRGLYGMVDLPPSPLRAPGAAVRLASALLAGGAKVLQLRIKGAPAAEMLAVLDELRPLLQTHPEVLLIVNDRLDVALSGGAHGVHLGQTDMPLLVARRMSPRGFVVGISTHDEAQAEAAIAGGADYIAFGPVFPTQSKSHPDPVVGLERLRALCRRSPVPVVAIGGITLSRAAEVAAAGAWAAAIIAAVNHAPDVAAAAAAVTRCFADQPSSGRPRRSSAAG